VPEADFDPIRKFLFLMHRSVPRFPLELGMRGLLATGTDCTAAEFRKFWEFGAAQELFVCRNCPRLCDKFYFIGVRLKSIIKRGNRITHTTLMSRLRLPLTLDALRIVPYQTQPKSINDSNTSGELATKRRR